MTRTVSRCSRKAFTLIELLVVVAIIGVLASLLLPALAKGRVASKQAQCKSNLRQMSIALEMYLDDSDGVFPTYEWASKEQRFNWEIAVSTYLSGSSHAGQRLTRMQCPTARQGVLHETVPGKVFSFRTNPSYGYNSFGYVRPGASADTSIPPGLGGSNESPEGGSPLTPTRQAHLNSAADMLALGDGFRLKAAGGGALKLEESFYLGRVPNVGFTSAGAWTSNTPQEEDLAERRHKGRLNMAFSDGHVASGKIDQWYFSKAESDIRRWRTDNQAK